MKLELKTRKITLSHIKYGEVFEAKDTYYMRIVDKDSQFNTHVLNLETYKLEALPLNLHVIPHKTKLVPDES